MYLYYNICMCSWRSSFIGPMTKKNERKKEIYTYIWKTLILQIFTCLYGHRHFTNKHCVFLFTNPSSWLSRKNKKYSPDIVCTIACAGTRHLLETLNIVTTKFTIICISTVYNVHKIYALCNLPINLKPLPENVKVMHLFWCRYIFNFLPA